MSVDTAGLDQAVRNYAREKADALGKEFVNTAQGLAPRRTGAGADSIEAGDPAESSGGFTIQVTVGEVYMRYQNEGTGIYGPDGHPIVPINGTFLRFDSPILGIVFVRSVRGTEPTRWWERAVEAWPQIVGAA